MRIQPGSSSFKMLCGASIAYGLTKGGYNAPEIAIEPLGLRIVRPIEEGDDLNARRLALFKPRVIGEFLSKYKGGKIPREDIALNVLMDLGVPRDRAKSVFDLIMTGAEAVGFIKEIKGNKYVDLGDTPIPPRAAESDEAEANGKGNGDGQQDEVSQVAPVVSPPARSALRSVSERDETEAGVMRRVYISHGKNKGLLALIQRLLGFSELEPVVTVDHGSVSQSVTDKVLNDMRSCGGAIIHIEAEKVVNEKGEEHSLLNENVLIEIGAAMALYGRRYIFLTKEGTKLPSNIGGLYEVRYSGASLDGDTTMKLMESIDALKKEKLPERYTVKGH